MNKEAVVIEVTVGGDQIVLTRKSGAVGRNERVRSVSLSWDTRLDLRTELSVGERTLMAEPYGVEGSRVEFVDHSGEPVGTL